MPQICTQKTLIEVVYGVTRKNDFLPFLLSLVIFNFITSVIFLLSIFDLLFAEIYLRLICLDICVMFLFVSVVIFFVDDSDQYETEEEL